PVQGPAVAASARRARGLRLRESGQSGRRLAMLKLSQDCTMPPRRITHPGFRTKQWGLHAKRRSQGRLRNAPRSYSASPQVQLDALVACDPDVVRLRPRGAEECLISTS